MILPICIQKYFREFQLFFLTFIAFDKYIGYKIGIENNGMINVSTIINHPEIKYLFKSESENIKGINNGCEIIINKIDSVIPKIDKELKSRFNYEVKN